MGRLDKDKRFIVVMAIVSVLLGSCRLTHEYTAELSPPPPEPTLTPEPKSMPEPLLHWQGIVPGESTKADVQEKLGPPYSRMESTLSDGTTRAVRWQYRSLEGREPEICSGPCVGLGSVYFFDDVVILMSYTFHQGPTTGELITILGEPEISGSLLGVGGVEHQQYLDQKSIDWRHLVSIWGYTYPNSGVFVILGPKYEDIEPKDLDANSQVPVFYPPDSMPLDDVPVNTIELFAPMSLEAYYESPLIVEWVKDFYP